MAHADKHTQTEPVKGQTSNDPEGKPPVDTEPPIPPSLVIPITPTFVQEPYGETATGTPLEGSIVGVIVDNPSDMAHEYANVFVNLGSDRYVRLGGPYPVEKKR